MEDPASLRAIGNDLRTGAAEQRQSNPPPEAVKLNGLLADIYTLLAQITTAGANGDYAEMQAYDAEYRELVPQADAEDKRLRQACL